MTTATRPGRPDLIRSINDRTALSLLLDDGPATRIEICRRTGVSRPTATQIVTRLEGAGLVEVVGNLAPARGPHALTYDVRAREYCGVAVDVGLRETSVAVVDVRGEAIPGGELTEPHGAGRLRELPDVRTVLPGVVDRAILASGIPRANVRAATVGVQGAVDPRTGDLRLLGDSMRWPTTHARAALEERLGLPVTIENDVNLAAMAEHHATGRESGTSAYVWLGQGIGVGLHVDGGLLRGATGAAGEIGYLPVPTSAQWLAPDAAELQDLVGGSAVIALAHQFGSGAVDLSALVAEAAANEISPGFTDAYARRVAVVLRVLQLVIDPDRMVLGGPLGAALAGSLSARTHEILATEDDWTPEVRAAQVRSGAALLGARAVVSTLVRELLLDSVG